ncbi:FAD-binding protein [Tunturiibacter gelidoferens]|uniref:Xylitol oxidase n=1 Tax=Tunturiibacter gelidiferens TaxID=3069689 RepID=A0ACC5P4Y0_9BACT|nr:FAD-binding protein [Edaphobacter lichenicola]MBB5341643.1 xylitol oxidase [Edaphobacter lichenicola]
MNKRQFLTGSGSVLTAAMLSRFVSASEQDAAHQTAPRTNWAGTLTFHTDTLYQPRTVDEVQHIVKGCDKLRALGRGHSFNTIADSTHAQISLKQLDSIDIDAKARTATVGAGVTYGKLAPIIDAQGFAVPNLASLPHVSVIGACATATHGSGSNNGNLATIVSGLELVTADGTLHTLSRAKDGDRFLGQVVNLGGLGVVTKTTLDLQPTFQVAQVVYENLSFSQLEHHLDEIFLSGYSVSLFTDWQNHRATEVWVKRRLDPGTTSIAFAPEFFGATQAKQKLHPVAGHSAESCTEQFGVPGPWYERLPHFKLNFIPSSGAEIQTEYFVPREHAYEAILAVEQLRDRITPHLFITELRTVAPDNLWLSMAYQRPSLAIHFTWKPENDAVQALLPLVEEKLAPFNARPHWAKVNTIPPSTLQRLYPKMPDYKALLNQYDPQGKFRNQFLATNIFGA